MDINSQYKHKSLYPYCVSIALHECLHSQRLNTAAQRNVPTMDKSKCEGWYHCNTHKGMANWMGIAVNCELEKLSNNMGIVNNIDFSKKLFSRRNNLLQTQLDNISSMKCSYNCGITKKHRRTISNGYRPTLEVCLEESNDNAQCLGLDNKYSRESYGYCPTGITGKKNLVSFPPINRNFKCFSRTGNEMNGIHRSNKQASDTKGMDSKLGQLEVIHE